MDRKAWKKRIKYRGDLTSRVTHLPKGKTEVEAFKNLIKILEEKCIKGSTRKKALYVEKYRLCVLWICL